MNKVLLVGRLTTDPELRVLSSGKSVLTFSLATSELSADGAERTEYTPTVAWDRLAETGAGILRKGQKVAIDGRLQTRSWDDDRGNRHWKTEVVASTIESL